MYLETVDMSDFEFEDMICPPEMKPTMEELEKELKQMKAAEMRKMIREARNRNAALELFYSTVLSLGRGMSKEENNRKCDETLGMMQICRKLHYLTQSGSEQYEKYIETKRK